MLAGSRLGEAMVPICVIALFPVCASLSLGREEQSNDSAVPWSRIGIGIGICGAKCTQVLDAGPEWPREVEETNKQIPTPLSAEKPGQQNDKDPYLGRVLSS